MWVSSFAQPGYLGTSEVSTQEVCQCLAGECQQCPKFNVLCVIKSYQHLGSINVIQDAYKMPLSLDSTAGPERD